MTEVLEVVGSALTESALFSAYDLHYRLLPNARAFLDKPEIVFLDSGGYEANSEYDEGQVYQPEYRGKQWSEARLKQVLDSLHRRLRLVIVNHDFRGAFARQAAAATRFFSGYSQHVHDFLIKPEGGDAMVDIGRVVKQSSLLSRFDMIGVTEKELGPSLLDRLFNIHTLRTGLDEAGLPAPIHIFGSLDPLTVPLFAAAGAEVFDGLSWLRYYFHEGLSVYRDHAGLLTENRGVHVRMDFVRGFAFSENLARIRQLEFDLRSFARSGSCEVFGPTRTVIERGLEALGARLYGG